MRLYSINGTGINLAIGSSAKEAGIKIFGSLGIGSEFVFETGNNAVFKTEYRKNITIKPAIYTIKSFILITASKDDFDIINTALESVEDIIGD